MYTPIVDELAGLLSGLIACPLDQGKVTTWLLIHIGMGYAYRSVQGYMPRLIFGMALGTLFCLSMFTFSRPKAHTSSDGLALHFPICSVLRYDDVQGKGCHLYIHRRIRFLVSLPYKEDVGK